MIPDTSPADLERDAEAIAKLEAIIRNRFHAPDDHHPLCSLKNKSVCDCYAREDMKAHAALTQLVCRAEHARKRADEAEQLAGRRAKDIVDLVIARTEAERQRDELAARLAEIIDCIKPILVTYQHFASDRLVKALFGEAVHGKGA